MVCSLTFKAIQNKKDELSCVGLQGMDYSELHAMRTPFFSLFTRFSRLA